MEQIELANQIQKEMEEMGYKLVPDLSRISELLDTKGWDEEKKRAYYQNLAKIGLEQAFSTLMVDMMTNNNKAQENG
jgi:uncharacterized membrane-anchored protein YjiN (DUF445 family)